MCGYSGFIFTKQSQFYLYSNLKEDFYSAALNIEHRGNEPLKKNYYETVFLAHSRLGFQDLQNNIQPFCSRDREWAIVFNGEIYNYKELRSQIQKEFNETFITQGDTEVILLGFLNYGKKFVEKLSGEFSFVIFKTDGSEVFAARDNFGVKPLFIAIENCFTSQFALAKRQYAFKTFSLNFSSEIKGLFIKKNWDKEGFLRQAVGLYEPIRTPFENIIALPANSTLHAKKVELQFHVQINLNHDAIRIQANSSENNFSSLQEEIQKAVCERTLSDVELGVYLSGGIDSKIVAFELAQHYKRVKNKIPLKAFHISFSQSKYDESKEVKKFSKHLNLDLNILKLSQKELKYSYPHAVYYSENIQPYTNGAAKWWLSLFASRQVKGVLTGDGADELFCGYPSFQYAKWWKYALRNRPGKTVQEKISNMAMGQSKRDQIYSKKFSSYLKDPIANGFNEMNFGLDLIESIQMWDVAHPLFEEIKKNALSYLGKVDGYVWLKQQKESIRSWFAFGLNNTNEFIFDSENTLLLWQNYFCQTHLPVQVLNWVGDRMEMGNHLEGRTPFLATNIKKYIYNLPDRMFVNGFQEKYLLRKNYSTLLMGYNTNPKKQFTAPLIFSDSLKKVKYNIFHALEKTNLLDKNIVFKQDWTYPQLKTLESFYLVQGYLMEGDKPVKNLDYENKLIHQKNKLKS